MPTLEDFKSQTSQLSPDDRAKLAYFLLDTLEPEEVASEEEIREAWRVEIAHRIEEIRSGRAKGIPFDDLMAELREKYP
jgi:putative addiction module component (TIGR02574 family)